MGVDEDFCVVSCSQQHSSIPCVAHLADSSVLALVLLKIFSDFMLMNVDTLWSLLRHAYEMPSLKLSSKSSVLCLYIPHRHIKTSDGEVGGTFTEVEDGPGAGVGTKLWK